MTTTDPVTALSVTTVRLPDAVDLLRLLPEHGPLAWVSAGEGLVGWGEAARIEVAGFDQARAWWDAVVAETVVRDDVRLPGSGLVAFGSFAFDGGTSVLVVPEVVAGHRDGTTWLTRTGAAGIEPRSVPRPPVGLTYADDAGADDTWARAVGDAVARIDAGHLEKVVLARDVHVHASEPVDVRWALARLADGYPDCWTFSVDGLVGATPEVLVRLRDGLATSRVLAGTLRRSGDSNEDLRRSGSFQGSIKDVEEHGYAVRSVADSLAPFTTSLSVPPAPFVLALPNVMHLASDLSATVAPGTSSLDLVAALHPSAAVCGTPTAVALEVIREVEVMDRGRYAGPVGWTGASGDGEWGIALRCASVDPADPAHLRLFAGCGIVSGSKPDDELAESVAKLVPMRDALGS